MNKKRIVIGLASLAMLQSPVARSDSDTVMAVLQHQIAEITELGSVQAAITGIIEKMTQAAMDLGHSDAQKEIVAQGVVGDGISQTVIDAANQDKVFWMTPDVGTCKRKADKNTLEKAYQTQEQVRAKVNSVVGTRVRGSGGGGGSSGGGKITPLKVHDEIFCAPSDVDRKYCSSVSQYADYDLSAANFMQPEKGTYNPTERKAAAQFIVNTTVPTPIPLLPKNYSSEGSTEVQKYREAHNAYASRISSASEAMSDVLALNSPPTDDSASKSLFQLIKEQVEGRAMGDGGEAFTTALTKGGPGTAVRSAAEMESMTNLLLLKIWESELRQQVLLGQIESMMAQQNMGTQLAERQMSIGSTDVPRN